MTTTGLRQPLATVAPGGQGGGGRHWWSVPPAPDGPALISTGRAYLEVLVVFGVFFGAGIAAAIFALSGTNPRTRVFWSDAIPAAIHDIGTTVLCVLVPVLLVRRRGAATSDLGLAKPARGELPQWIRIAAWAVLALIVSGIITSLLATGNYPIDHSIASLTYNLVHGIQAGLIEEIVVLAFVVLTLEQARRPRAEIVAVALVLRLSYHVYYGPGVVGALVWASIFLWLFFRFRTIVPLIVVHSTWDVLIFLTDQWRGVGALTSLAYLTLFITAFVLWLNFRSDRARTRKLGAPGPAWYPDPGGSGGLRWFDGRQWTGFTQGPAPVPPPGPTGPGPAPGGWPGSGWPPGTAVTGQPPAPPAAWGPGVAPAQAYPPVPAPSGSAAPPPPVPPPGYAPAAVPPPSPAPPPGYPPPGSAPAASPPAPAPTAPSSLPPPPSPAPSDAPPSSRPPQLWPPS